MNLMVSQPSRKQALYFIYDDFIRLETLGKPISSVPFLELSNMIVCNACFTLLFLLSGTFAFYKSISMSLCSQASKRSLSTPCSCKHISIMIESRLVQYVDHDLLTHVRTGVPASRVFHFQTV